MKTMTIILCDCCHSINHTNWQPVIDAIPCLCWGIFMLIALYFLLKYIAVPLITNCHELKIKDDNYEKEKFWSFLNHEISKEQCQKELDDTNTKLKKLQDKEKELDDGTENLKNEKAKWEKTILEEKENAYKEIIKYLGKCTR